MPKKEESNEIISYLNEDGDLWTILRGGFSLSTSPLCHYSRELSECKNEVDVFKCLQRMMSFDFATETMYPVLRRLYEFLSNKQLKSEEERMCLADMRIILYRHYLGW